MSLEQENFVDVIRQIPAVPSILDVVCRATGMGFAAVARVTNDRWIACEVLDNIDFGLKPGGELRIETTICNEIRDSRDAVVIDHVAEDAAFCGHHTPAMYGFQSYISMPIILADGSFFGTLCAIDPRLMKLNTPETVGMFKLFAELIAVHIDARSKMLSSQQNLADEREKREASQDELALAQNELMDERTASELREQFIAVLGHDLRNPLAAISGGTSLLLRRTEDEKSKTILLMMTASVQRMSGLIENVMDFARGRLGGGLTLTKENKSPETIIATVIDEISSAWPNRKIERIFDLDHSFDGDHARLGQLLSNLLGNAITHGAEDQPIRVKAATSEQGFTLSVSNGGAQIPRETLERLFQPFQRGEGRSSLQGLGLGLFIASEIARAHGGTLEVMSDDTETRFTLNVLGDGSSH
ncbi:GAF domain-containing protein [Rhizobiales bacterium RZME27]|uniref:histidine kinase n=1 Tax=Endobacterium cereale TaxID=2663029 RepID=A0A6A8AFN7_9HYPH|nr:GAF domain-containing sensor histidine kinase [Endobacterium cereale]MQY47571.1 GAF domain-containing protein [Endobacterium cereale]